MAKMSPQSWGILAGGGITGLTPLMIQLATKSGSDWRKYKTYIGLGAGAAFSGALYAMKKTRSISGAAILTTAIVGGLRALENYLEKTQAEAASTPTGALAELGVITAEEAEVYGDGVGADGDVEVLGVTTAERAGMLGDGSGMGEDVEVLGMSGAFGANPATVAGWR